VTKIGNLVRTGPTHHQISQSSFSETRFTSSILTVHAVCYCYCAHFRGLFRTAQPASLSPNAQCCIRSRKSSLILMIQLHKYDFTTAAEIHLDSTFCVENYTLKTRAFREIVTIFFTERVVMAWNSLPNAVDLNSLAVLNVLLNV